MVDPRIEKLAKLCVQYSVAVKPKEKVLIRGHDVAHPLMNEIYKECLLSDADPWVLPRADVDYTFYKYAKKHQLRDTFARSVIKSLFKKIDVQISVLCNPNPKGLTGIDAAKIAMNTAAWKDLSELWEKRQASGELKWILLPYPIGADAQEASMALPEYEDFVYRSCLVDKEEPVKEWKKISASQERICKYLNNVDKIEVTGEDTDLAFSVKGRKWWNQCGKSNMPDGEVATGPVENSVNGTVRFSYPGIYSDREVEDITLTFEDGKVTKAKAAKDNELLQEILKIEGADRIGEAAIGTNYGITKFTKNILFDEKMGGTIHMALGASYPQTGGLNKSAVHWDLLKDMKKDGEIRADGKLIYRKGKFLI
jgi:aminopeptidase